MPPKNKVEKAAYDKQYAEKNKQTISDSGKVRYRENSEMHKNKANQYYANSGRVRRIIRLYKVSLEEAQRLLNATTCEICGIDLTTPYVDHDHEVEPRRVRGVLCLQCNTALGSFKDNAQTLGEAQVYLQQRQRYKKIYVATKYEEKNRAREIMELLRAAGHTITYDWTRYNEAQPLQAMLDLRGVADADTLVGIFEKDLPYQGSLVELGAALVQNKAVYVLGNAPVTETLFFFHPHVRRGEIPFMRDLLNARA